MEQQRSHILIVDDDQEISDLVRIHLETYGYTIYQAENGIRALQIFDEKPVELAILDIMMPGMDGYELCQFIREKSNIPIIMLSAKDTGMDKVAGLGGGADDYVTKPFEPLELVARVQSHLRRYQNLGGAEAKIQADVVEVEHLKLDKSKRKVIAYGNEVRLTPIEFEILYLLASHRGEVFSTNRIFECVWKDSEGDTSNTVMVHIRRLREKIEKDSTNARIIKTIWGVGYKID